MAIIPSLARMNSVPKIGGPLAGYYLPHPKKFVTSYRIRLPLNPSPSSQNQDNIHYYALIWGVARFEWWVRKPDL